MEERFQSTRPPLSHPTPASLSTHQNTSILGAPITRASIGNNPTEPIYSTVIPPSQRHAIPSQQSSEPLKPPQTTRTWQTPAVSLPSLVSTHAPSTGDTSTSQLRMRYLEQMVARLDREKKAMEEEFGRQRKKFMKEMVQAESEGNLAKESISRHVTEIENLNLRVITLEHDLKSYQSGVDPEKARLKQEVESLKQQMLVTSHEHRVQLERLRNDWLHEKKSLETQNTQLRVDNKNLHLASQEGKKGSKKPTSRDRSKSPSRSRNRSPRSPIPSEGTKSPPLDGAGENPSLLTVSSTGAVNFSSENSMESSMLEAAKESQLLRAVVVPLEEEIDLLRIQLREAQERLEVYEANTQSADSQHLYASVSPTVMGGATTEDSGDISEKELLEKLLSQERAARHDLEMHSDGLRRQKTMLLSDIEELKQHLQKTQCELKSQKDDYIELKKAWENANLNFRTSEDGLRNQLLELQQKMKHDKKIRDRKLQEIGAVSPRPPLSPEPPAGDVTHPSTPGRKRAVSWSGSGQHERENSGKAEALSWKPLVEQLQRLIVELRKDLDSKETTVEEYKQQLERVQSQLTQELDEREMEIMRIKEDHDKIKAALIRERKSREEFRRQLVSEKETMKSRVEQFQAGEMKMKQKVKGMKDKFTEMKHSLQKEMTQFTEERVKLHELLDQQKEEYDCLKGVHASEMTEYQQNMKKLEELKKEAEMNVASTMEELARVRDAGKASETEQSAQIADLKQQVSQSLQEKKSLTNQLGELQNDLLEIQKVNNELEKECNSLKTSRSTLHEKSKNYIEEQRKQIEELMEEKTKLQGVEQDLHLQLAQLKQQLETSEANQKDFVKLSQSLQVRLAEIEEQVPTQQQQQHISQESADLADSSNVLS